MCGILQSGCQNSSSGCFVTSLVNHGSLLTTAARSQRRPSSWADLPPLHQAAVGVTFLADAAVAEGRAATAMLLNTGVPELLIQVQDDVSSSRVCLTPHLHEHWLWRWDRIYVVGGVPALLS